MEEILWNLQMSPWITTLLEYEYCIQAYMPLTIKWKELSTMKETEFIEKLMGHFILNHIVCGISWSKMVWHVYVAICLSGIGQILFCIFWKDSFHTTADLIYARFNSTYANSVLIERKIAWFGQRSLGHVLLRILAVKLNFRFYSSV